MILYQSVFADNGIVGVGKPDDKFIRRWQSSTPQ